MLVDGKGHGARCRRKSNEWNLLHTKRNSVERGAWCPSSVAVLRRVDVLRVACCVLQASAFCILHSAFCILRSGQ